MPLQALMFPCVLCVVLDLVLIPVLGLCGIRIFWVACVFSASPTFLTLMLVYPVSLSATALLILGAVLFCRPAKVYGRKAA